MTRQLSKMIIAFIKQETTKIREQADADVDINNQPLSAETMYENHGASPELH